ncbi:MAG: hypothetical protein ACKO43_03785, partial [Alphaproteobacteria bacterium]
MIEFDQTFAVLSPNPSIRDLYKTASLTAPTVKTLPSLSFAVTTPAAPVPAPVLPIAETPEETQDLQQPEVEAPEQAETQQT